LSNEDLLRPTLSAYSRPPALYHTTGFALAAFFGGPVGAAVYSLANTRRLARLRQDAPVIIIVMALALLVPMMLVRAGQFDAFANLAGMTRSTAGEVLLRGLGFVCFGAIYLLHRRFFRAARVSGVKTLPSWPVGIAALASGWAANAALVNWILKHH